MKRKKHLQHNLVFLTTLAALLIVCLLAEAAPSGGDMTGNMTLGTYCKVLETTRTQYVNNKEVAANLLADYKRNCSTLNWPENANSRYDGEINPYIGTDPDVVRTPEQINSLIENADNGMDVASRFGGARNAATNLVSECMAQSGKAMASSEGVYRRTMALMTGDQFAQGCQQIPSYEQAANASLQTSQNLCGSYQRNCKELMDAADEVYRRVQATLPMTDLMTTDRAVGYNSCNVIGERVSELQRKVAQAKADLTNSCANARAQAQQAKNNTAVAEESTARDRNRQDLYRQAAKVLPVLSQLLSAPENAALPVDLGNGQYQPSQLPPSQTTGNSGYEAVGKGIGAQDSAPSPAGGDSLILGEDPAFENSTYQKTQMGQSLPGPGGGGAGSPAVGNGRAGNSGEAGSGKKNAGRGQGFATGVYNGHYGIGGMAARGSGGYAEAPPARRLLGGQGRDPRLRTRSVPSLGVDLRRFLPQWHGTRRAASMTGPDGITGPHSNLFQKVRIRYEWVPLNVDPLTVLRSQPRHGR